MTRIGILAHEFLINTGANDFLKNLLRGLSYDSDNELIFLAPLAEQKIERAAPSGLKARLGKHPRVKKFARAAARRVGPVADKVMRQHPDEYSHYFEACPAMELVPCAQDKQTLIRLREELRIDVFFPSIHVLPKTLPHVNYWPDCQPKHLPEFFDDESQRVRDERILGLLNSGSPMIVNSFDAKRDMKRFYGARTEQVFDLPFAPIIEFDRLIPRPELVKSYRLERPYFIICNQFWIHKSLETVIEAAALAKSAGMDAEFVFTGKMEEPRRPEYIDYLRKLVEKLGVSDRIRFLGYIPKADQLELLKHSIAVVQPTLFEGGPGGGAVYDAYSLGVRSIVSDIPINHELPLDSGRVTLFEKKSAEDLVEKLASHIDAGYVPPSAEDLYQQSKQSTIKLSSRLGEVIAAVAS